MINDLKKHSKNVYSIKFSQKGEFLASGGEDCLVIFWNYVEGTIIKIFRNFFHSINEMDFSLDHLIIGNEDGKIISINIHNYAVNEIHAHKDSIKFLKTNQNKDKIIFGNLHSFIYDSFLTNVIFFFFSINNNLKTNKNYSLKKILYLFINTIKVFNSFILQNFIRI